MAEGKYDKGLIANAGMMADTIRRLGIVPFFIISIPGYSIQELTRPGCWFDGDEDPLGPWDWKIDCIRDGDIAYGKFLCGGKASFATVLWYRELMNVRRARLRPDTNGERILACLEERGTITIREVRGLLGVKKSAADAAIARLQHQCRVVTGDISRVYRGQQMNYNGWQVASFCTPESLFQSGQTQAAFPGFPVFEDEADLSLETSHTPEESLELLIGHIAEVTRSLRIAASHEDILKILR